MINHERWEDNEWDYAPDAHEPMEMPEEWVYTEPNEGPEKRDPFAEIFTGENSLVGKITKGIADALEGAPSLEEWLKPVEEAAKRLIRPVEDRVKNVEEQADAAVSDIRSLDGVRGYAQAHMSVNIYSGGLGSDNTRWMPFDYQYGVWKGAHLGVDSEDPVQVGIVLEESGLWRVDVRAFAKSTTATAGLGVPDNSEVYLGVYRISATGVWNVWREISIIKNNGGGATTLEGGVMVQIPDDGYQYAVGAYCWSSRWRWWSGGARYSSLSVVKHDNRNGDLGQYEVPDDPNAKT